MATMEKAMQMLQKVLVAAAILVATIASLGWAVVGTLTLWEAAGNHFRYMPGWPIILALTMFGYMVVIMVVGTIGADLVYRIRNRN